MPAAVMPVVSSVRSTGQAASLFRNICSACQESGEKKLQSSRGLQANAVSSQPQGLCLTQTQSLTVSLLPEPHERRDRLGPGLAGLNGHGDIPNHAVKQEDCAAETVDILETVTDRALKDTGSLGQR